MGRDAHLAFMSSGGIGASAERGAQSALHARDDALDLPALPGLGPRKPFLHLGPVRRAGHGVGPTAVVDRDDGSVHAQLLPAEPVVRLGVVSGVGVEGLYGDPPCSLAHDGRQARGFVARPAAGQGSGDQVRRVMAQNGQPRIAPEPFRPAAAAQKVVADMVAFQAGGPPKADLGRALDQAAQPGAFQGGVQKGIEGPLFCRRCSAFCRVVKCGTFFSASTSRRSLRSSRSCATPR